jgi:hypothetical protein
MLVAGSVDGAIADVEQAGAPFISLPMVRGASRCRIPIIGACERIPGPATEAGAWARSTDDDWSHAMTAHADRHLLFGLLALQNGLIDQGALVAAFQAWTRDKTRSLADQLVAQGDLDADACAGLQAIVALHVKRHGDVEHSLAAVPANRLTRANLAGRSGSGVSGAEAVTEADATTALIRKAIEMGYRATYVYRNEDAFDPLRSRDDFRLLLMDLEFPSDPFAPDTEAHRRRSQP